MKIGVKFCGNCNPYLDMTELFNRLLQDGEFDLHIWNESTGFDVLLVLNSCPVGCATYPPSAAKTVIVTNDTVDNRPLGNDDLYEAIKKALLAN